MIHIIPSNAATRPYSSSLPVLRVEHQIDGDKIRELLRAVAEVGGAEAVAKIVAEFLPPAQTLEAQGFFVSVDGMAAPKRQHITLQEANAEADRLAASNTGKMVRVLQQVAWRKGKQVVTIEGEPS